MIQALAQLNPGTDFSGRNGKFRLAGKLIQPAGTVKTLLYEMNLKVRRLPPICFAKCRMDTWRPFQLLYSSAAFFAASLDVFTAFVRKQETKRSSNVPRCSKNFAFILTGLNAPTNRYAIKWGVLGTFWNGWNVKEAQRYS
jgi:hypothetical protein